MLSYSERSSASEFLFLIIRANIFSRRCITLFWGSLLNGKRPHSHGQSFASLRIVYEPAFSANTLLRKKRRYDENYPVLRVACQHALAFRVLRSGEVIDSGFGSLTFEKPSVVRFEDNTVDTSDEFEVSHRSVRCPTGCSAGRGIRFLAEHPQCAYIRPSEAAPPSCVEAHVSESRLEYRFD